MPRDQPLSRGGVNQPRTEPDQGQGNALPGAEKGPAPPQLINRLHQSHQH